jgi:hypothetical protein
MSDPVNRRQFVTNTVLASAGAAMALHQGQTAGAAEIDEAKAPPLAGGEGLPTGKIGDVDVSRLLLGGNLLTHYTHSRDLKYVYSLAKHYNTEEKILETLALAEDCGVNTLAIHNVRWSIETLKKHRQRGGKMQWITCSNHAMRRGWDAQEREVQQLVDDGADIIYISGVDCDWLTSQQQVDLIGRAVDSVKFHGLPCGVGAHRLEVIVECEKAGLDSDFYVKTFHHHNYPSAKLEHDSMWCYQPEEVIGVMRDVKKPWIAFKVMAAGAIPPQAAFRYAFENGADFVLAGMFDFEIAEDVRIAKEVLSGVKRNRPWLA